MKQVFCELAGNDVFRRVPSGAGCEAERADARERRVRVESGCFRERIMSGGISAAIRTESFRRGRGGRK